MPILTPLGNPTAPGVTGRAARLTVGFWLSLAGLLPVTSPLWADDLILTPERILSFNSNLRVQPDAALDVTETITLTATGDQIKNGLTRVFPVRGLSPDQGLFQADFELLQALCNGQPEPYRLEKTEDGIAIALGRKEVRLIPGVYVYTLRYRISRQLGLMAAYDELYWNVTGNQLPFKIEKINVRVEIPLGARVLQSAAYTGAYGARDSNFIQTFDEQLQPMFATTRTLLPGEGFSITVSWPKGFVRQPTVWELRRRYWYNRANLILWLIGALVLAAAVYYGIQRKRKASRLKP